MVYILLKNALHVSNFIFVQDWTVVELENWVVKSIFIFKFSCPQSLPDLATKIPPPQSLG